MSFIQDCRIRQYNRLSFRSTVGLLDKLHMKNDDDSKSTSTKNKINNIAGMNPLTKASWYAVEAFGKIFGSDGNKRNGIVPESETLIIVDDITKSPTTIEETLRRIRNDNERDYFLSGQIDTLIYDPNCIFSDPFVSFQGRDRFVDNLANLGSFITQYSAKPIKYDIINLDDDTTKPLVTTKFMVKLELNLPWRPVLAWPWGVKCSIDRSTNLVVRHEESVRCWIGLNRLK
jgi:Uncharacterized conserved protein (DUF2358)